MHQSHEGDSFADRRIQTKRSSHLDAEIIGGSLLHCRQFTLLVHD